MPVHRAPEDHGRQITKAPDAYAGGCIENSEYLQAGFRKKLLKKLLVYLHAIGEAYTENPIPYPGHLRPSLGNDAFQLERRVDYDNLIPHGHADRKFTGRQSHLRPLQAYITQQAIELKTVLEQQRGKNRTIKRNTRLSTSLSHTHS
jgi:hypothetical protein